MSAGGSPPEPSPESAGVPPSIAAIMAAIRHEVTGGAAAGATPAATPDADRIDPPATVPVAEPVAAPAASPPALPPGPHPSRDRAAAEQLPAHLDDAARALLAPMIQRWLDAHLPEIVEAAVHAELRRLTGQARAPREVDT